MTRQSISLIRKARAEEQKHELIRARLIASEQSGFVTPDRESVRKEFKAHKKA
jgi:antitoxin ParD1/3/4